MFSNKCMKQQYTVGYSLYFYVKMAFMPDVLTQKGLIQIVSEWKTYTLIG